MDAKQDAPKHPIDQWRNQRWDQTIHEDKWKGKHKGPKSLGCSKSSSKRQVYGTTGLPQKTIKISNKKPNLNT